MFEPTPALFLHEGNWQADAACTIATADYFFPDGNSNATKEEVRYARKICRECPVIVECLKSAIEHKEPEGIWGGFTKSERDVFKRSAYNFQEFSKDSLVRALNEEINRR